MTDCGISDLVPQQKWKWIRIHNISLARRMGPTRGGDPRKLREELEVENTGMCIPAEIRWLSSARPGPAPRLTGMAPPRWWLRRWGRRFLAASERGGPTLGHRYEINASEEAWRPDAFCGKCSERGHIAPHCQAAAPRCVVYSSDHHTTDHRRPVEGRRVGRGRHCPHVTVKCANCDGPHGAQAEACAAKRTARQACRGWRPTPPPQGANSSRGRDHDCPGGDGRDRDRGGVRAGPGGDGRVGVAGGLSG